MISTLVLALTLGQASSPQSTSVTAGQVILSVTSKDPAVRSQVAGALAHPDPIVRAAAARVLAAYGESAHSRVIAERLASEMSPIAAAEQARALLVLQRRSAFAVLDAAVERIGGAVVPVYAEWLARNDRQKLEQSLDVFAKAVDASQATAVGEILQVARSHQSDSTLSQRWNELIAARALGLELVFGSAPSAPPLRTPDIWLPKMLSDVARAAGCRLSGSPLYALAGVAFGQDGRPASVEIDPVTLSTECAEAFTALVLTQVASPNRPVLAGEKEPILLPFGKDLFACGDVDDPPAVRFAKGMTPPRKTRDLLEYPVEARKAGRQGTVYIEIVISSHGCVREAKVLRSLARDLDIAAIISVTQWRFEPIRQRGRPTPVRFVVTVSFKR